MNSSLQQPKLLLAVYPLQGAAAPARRERRPGYANKRPGVPAMRISSQVVFPSTLALLPHQDGKAPIPSAAKRIFAAVGNVQEAILILVVLVHVRHQRGCARPALQSAKLGQHRSTAWSATKHSVSADIATQRCSHPSKLKLASR